MMNLTIKNIAGTALTVIFAIIISAMSISAATFTVTNTNDSGAGSLRDAITQANTNAQADTINFDPAFFNFARTITLTSGEILITPDDQNGNGLTGRLVTINGPGASLLTISGNNASRIFLLAGNPGREQQNANVTMSGMTLRDGNGVGALTGDGGAIYAHLAANLTLNSMVIRNNVITAAASGGGIYANGVSNTVINDSLITENSAYNVGGLRIDNIQELSFTMRNTTVSNNTATPGDVGGMSIIRGYVDIKNCQITGNVATRSFGGISVYQAVRLDVSYTVISGNDGMADNGGGLATDGSSIVNLRRLNVSSNMGTGISIRNPSGIVTLMDSTVSNNSLRDYPGFVGESGGGISIAPVQGGTVKIINTTVSGNSAVSGGGGIYNEGPDTQLINSTVVNNSAASGGNYGGGGIYDGNYSRDGTPGYRIKLQNTIVAGNTAPLGPDLRIQFTSFGYNLIGNTNGSGASTAAAGDQFNVNPNVGPLADNGGPTRTHALLSGSPAINAGSNALAVDQNGNPLQYDQRGACFDRIVGGTVDIGAFEKDAESTCPPSNNNPDTAGVFRPSNGITYLRNSNTGGFADIDFIYGNNGDTSIAGDWDGDGKDSLGIYRNGLFYLRNTNSTGPADIVFAFGDPTDQPIAGDWDGDGIDTIGLYRRSTGVFILRNSNSAGPPDAVFVLGNPNDIAIAGDWDGDGIDTTGVFRPSNGIIYLKNTNVSGFADIYLVYGNAGDKPLAGDWDGDGFDSVGIYRNGVMYLRNSNTQGVADIVFAFGDPGDEPIAGDWDGLP